MKVEVSPEAEADIDEIGRYISRDSPTRAASFMQELLAACHAVGQFPSAAPIMAGQAGGELRRKVFGRYLIFYRVTPTLVEIVRVLHGARNVQRILFRNDP